MTELLARFPDLRSWFSRPPIVVNAYPVSFTPPAKVVFADSYGRWQVLGAGLALAAQHDLPAVIISTPLMAAHLLLTLIERQISMPSKILLFLGGYYCPNSLELFLVSLLKTAGIAATIVHLYGVAEIDAGLLAAKREPHGYEMVFHSIDPDWCPRIENGLLRFQRTSDTKHDVATDDGATVSGDGIRLSIQSRRLSHEMYALLENFTFDDWHRRTGFLGRPASGIAIQCRSFIAPKLDQSEVEHFDFCRAYTHSWLDKPQWI